MKTCLQRTWIQMFMGEAQIPAPAQRALYPLQVSQMAEFLLRMCTFWEATRSSVKVLSLHTQFILAEPWQTFLLSSLGKQGISSSNGRMQNVNVLHGGGVTRAEGRGVQGPESSGGLEPLTPYIHTNCVNFWDGSISSLDLGFKVKEIISCPLPHRPTPHISQGQWATSGKVRTKSWLMTL